MSAHISSAELEAHHSQESGLTGTTRSAAIVSGPLAGVALLAFIGSLVATGGDSLKLATSPLSIAASLTGVMALVALTIGMFSVAANHRVLQTGIGRIGWLVTITGTVLATGGQWAQLFVLPGLAGPAPELAINGIDSVVAGYITSYIVLGAGWLIVGITLLRAGAASRGLAWFVIIGAVLCVPPLPVRFVFVAVAVSLIARRAGARADGAS